MSQRLLCEAANIIKPTLVQCNEVEYDGPVACLWFEMYR